MRAYLQNLARYDAWANKQLFNSLTGAAATDGRVLHLLGHLVAAKQVWLGRIRGEETSAWNLWPTHSVEAARGLLAAADGEMFQLTADAGRDFSRVITYRNQTLKTFETRVDDILIHLTNHATYHRGQLATAVKEAGGVPAVTDYIAWVRAGSPTVAPLVG